MSEIYSDLRALIVVIIGIGVIWNIHTNMEHRCISSGGSPSQSVLIQCE